MNIHYIIIVTSFPFYASHDENSHEQYRMIFKEWFYEDDHLCFIDCPGFIPEWIVEELLNGDIKHPSE